MRVHLVGLADRGMAQLALLLRSAGHEVSASVRSNGWNADGVTKDVELVVVADAVAADNPEVVRAAELALARSTLAGVLREQFLAGKRPLVVADADATTAGMCAWILETAGLEPGYLFDGFPTNLGAIARAASSRRKILGGAAKPAPFVVGGDFFDAKRTGLDTVVVVRAADDVSELRAGKSAGLLVCDARHPRAAELGTDDTQTPATFYGLDNDPPGEVTPSWLAAVVTVDAGSGVQPFDLYAGGSFGGRFALKVSGNDNVRSAVAAIAACAEGFGVHIEKARQALATFEGVHSADERP